MPRTVFHSRIIPQKNLTGPANRLYIKCDFEAEPHNFLENESKLCNPLMLPLLSG